VSVQVTPRARGRPDRGGDPLDGLVNLFDLGVVLAVAFLLAALLSLHLEDTLTKRGGLAREREPAVRVGKDQRARPLGPRGGKVIGRGQAVGTVYRLQDGRLVYTERKP
jgi:hypothetical protein